MLTFTQFSFANADEDFDSTFCGSYMDFPAMPNVAFFYDKITKNDSFVMHKALRNYE